MSGRVPDSLIGCLEIVLAAAVLRHLWQFRRGFPWLVPLIAFFLLRGIDRVVVAFLVDEPATLSFVLDALLVAVLVLLVIGIDHLVSGLEIALDAAREQADEYRRALADYRTLARHRLANPMTTIIGGVHTLRELGTTDPGMQNELMEMIDQAARRLEQISLEPTDELSTEERDLRPQPRR